MTERTILALKEIYKEIEKSFELPSFERMLEDFDMDKLLEKEDGLLIRDIRRVIMEKLSGYLHLFETLINPSSPPMFVFAFMKNISASDKKDIKEIYKELSSLQIKTLRLDTIYNETNEADFIKSTYKKWQDLKRKIYSLIGNFEKEFEENSETREKSYFG